MTAASVLFVASLAHELLGPDGLTAHDSSFIRRDVIEALCNGLPAGVTVDCRTLEGLADRLLADAGVILVAHEDPDDVGATFVRRDGRSMPIALQDRRFSTDEFLAVEQRLIDRAVDGTAAGLGVVRDEHLQRALGSRPTTSAEQTAMVARSRPTALRSRWSSVERAPGRLSRCRPLTRRGRGPASRSSAPPSPATPPSSSNPRRRSRRSADRGPRTR